MKTERERVLEIATAMKLEFKKNAKTVAIKKLIESKLQSQAQNKEAVKSVYAGLCPITGKKIFK